MKLLRHYPTKPFFAQPPPITVIHERSEEVMSKFGGVRRASIVSFDFKQRGPSQARKTRFFRELYGYTQRIKQQLKNGKIVTRTYHYTGLLDQTSHVKLGKSVFGLRPGTEGPILRLLESFDEVIYYHFIGWLPVSMWPEDDTESLESNRLIERYGSLSILIKLHQLGGRSPRTQLIEAGFDIEYTQKAMAHLQAHGWLEEEGDAVVLTKNGEVVVAQLP
jgi:hypothetical protein